MFFGKVYIVIHAGQLVEFLNKSQLMVGICLQVNAKHVRVLTEQNKETNLNEKKILHVLTQKLAPQVNRLEKVAALKDWSQRLNQAESDLELETLWEVLVEDPEPQLLEDLASMYFSESGDFERSLLLRLLLEDHVYFERKGEDGFAPRSPEVVKQILEQQAKENQKNRAREQTVFWIKENLVNQKDLAVPEEAKIFVPQIQDVAIRQQQSSVYPQVFRLLQEAGVVGKPEDQTLKLMIHSGIWDEDINLHLLEYEVPQYFSKELLQQVEQTDLDINKYLSRRKDLRHLPTITIDDADTTDIDDAISWEVSDNGVTRIWIHIADPAEFIQPDSLLDQEAVRRFTSIYLCEGKIEMLPVRLSQDLCSLNQAVDRLALSVGVDVSPVGEVLHTELCESVVQVDRRMTYLEVDAELETDPKLKQLYALSGLLKQKRLDRGAVEFTQPELRIKVSPDKEISLKRVERDSPAQYLVSEMMILANHLVALKLGRAGLPLIYKTQEAPQETHSDGRPLLKRAEMSTRMGPHFGLGLDAYTQFTSPIRRYNDLVLHRQIKSWLRESKGMYSEPEIQHIIALSDQAVFSANYIQRENYRYWLLKYFEKLPQPRYVLANLKNIKEDKGWVTLQEYCYDIPLPASELVGLELGSELMVSLDQVNPRKSRLYARKVNLAPAEAETEASVASEV